MERMILLEIIINIITNEGTRLRIKYKKEPRLFILGDLKDRGYFASVKREALTLAITDHLFHHLYILLTDNIKSYKSFR